MAILGPRPKTNNQPKQEFSTHLKEGMRSQEVRPQNQKKKRAKNGLNPYADIYLWVGNHNLPTMEWATDEVPSTT